MKFPAYPRYKPSGVEWLGDVPEHWDVKRLKTSADCWVSNVDKVPSEDELPVRLCNYTDVYYNERITPEMDFMQTTATADEIRRFGLHEDDVLITKDSEEWSDIAVPALVTKSAVDLVCGYHLAIVRPRKSVLSGRYVLRAFQACAVNQQFQVAASGVTRYGLPKAAIGDAWIPLPDLPEQKTIANFLDRETGRIDRLIIRKQELIERLKEKRSALTSRVVTRGLPAEAARAAGLPEVVRFKASGLDWLGDVPAHWQVKRLKFEVSRVEQGWSPQCDNVPASEGEWGVLKAGAVNGSEFDAKENKRLPDNEIPLREFEIKTGDFLISRANTRELVGSAAVVKRVQPQLLLCDKLYRLTIIKTRLSSEFLLRFMRSKPGHYEFERDASGSSASMQNIGQESVRNLWIPIPPLPEQVAIATYLDVETARLDALAAKVEEAIERLQEYRLALITGAVTGKIDVRKAAE